MAAWDYTNDYTATVNSPYTAGDTSLVVSGATGNLPTSTRKFILKVDSEYMLCTSYSGSTFTVVGAQGSSTAANHSNGATVTACWVIPSVLDGIRSDSSQIGTYANLPAAGMKSGDRYRTTDSALEFIYDGSNWQSFVGGQIGELSIPNALGSWSWVNQGSSTLTNVGAYQLFVPGSGSLNSSAYVRSVTVPYTAIIGFVPTISIGAGSDNEGAGIAIRDSGSGKIIYFLTTNSNHLVGFAFTNATTFSSTLLASATYPTYGPWWWFKIVNNSTNRLWYISRNGQSWIQVRSESTTNFLTENQIGIGAVVASGTSYPVYMDVYHWVD
jgi:hypothetical protein